MTNRFPGRCTECGAAVPAGAGQARKVGTQWVVAHITCPVLDADDASYEVWLARPVEPVTEPGMYRLPDGGLAKVQVSKSSGKPYAKRLVMYTTYDGSKGSFDYEAGLIRSLTPADRLSLVDAVAFGHQYGVCCVCGALLSDPKSVAAGIGPICAGRV